MKEKVIQTIWERLPGLAGPSAIERNIRFAFNKGYVAAFDAAGIRVSPVAALALYLLWKGRMYKEAWTLLGELMDLEGSPPGNHKG